MLLILSLCNYALYNASMQDWRPAADILHDLRTFISEGIAKGRFTQSSLASNAAVSQSTVSRILKNGSRCRVGSAVQDLCRYAGIDLHAGATNKECAPDASLLAAIQDVWNGSATHAEKLARIIRIIGPLCR